MRREAGKLPAAILAAIVHVFFFALIVFGVSWQIRTPTPISAQVWSALPPIRGLPPPVEPAPAVEVQSPAPVVEVATRPPPTPISQPVLPSKAEIELKTKREKEKREKAERERREEAERVKLAAREKAKKAEEAKVEAKAAQLRKAEQQRLREQQLAEERKRNAEEVAARSAQESREAAQQAARNAAIAAYADKIRALIRSRTNVPDNVSGKPVIQVNLRLLVNGVVFDARVTKPSGNRVYDEAIERAIAGIRQWPLPDNPDLLGSSRTITLNIEHER